MQDFHRLVDTVQRNCDISDARFGREVTLCTYLLEMRELYCWENELPLTALPPKDDLGQWLTRRESHWNDLEDEEFEPLPVAGHRLDPFDAPAVNAELIPHGYLYGGGYGRFHRPQFFLGQLVRCETRGGLDVLVAGCEYARGLSAPPAALQQRAVYLRQDALRRWLWEKVELWGTRRQDGALKSALDCHGFEADPVGALERMTEAETESMILHELGEGDADALLGPAWKDMLSSFKGKRAEVLARAVRDNLADCLSTLPELVGRGAHCSLHFYFANFEGMRRHLFPRAMGSYRDWRQTGDAAVLLDAAADGRGHWQRAAERLLDIHRTEGPRAESAIEALFDKAPASLSL